MEEFLKLIKQLEIETRSLIKSCMELSWYARSTSYPEFLQMTASERDIFLEFINHRMEKVVSKSQFPVY